MLCKTGCVLLILVCVHGGVGQNILWNTDIRKHFLGFNPEEYISPAVINFIGSSVSVKQQSREYEDRERQFMEETDGETYTEAGEEEVDEESLLGQIRHQLGSVRGVGADSGNCSEDINRLLNAVMAQEMWALRMLDATGKPGSGILDGDFALTGSYDECLSLTITKQEANFTSRFCTATMFPPSVLNQSSMGLNPTVVYLGLCLPDTCSSDDVTMLLSNLLQSNNISLMARVECQEREMEFDTKAIIAITVCAIFGFLVVLGTAYDTLQMVEDVDEEKEHVYAAIGVKYGALGRDPHVDSDKEALVASKSVEESQVVIETDQDTRLGSMGRKKTPPNERLSNQKLSTWAQVLLSFSAYTNGAKLLNTKQPAGSLTAIHGIRFLSMTWVILGHTVFTATSHSNGMKAFFDSHIDRWTFHAILNALVSVDTFFTLSGLLVAYLTLKELERGGGKLNWPMFYFHRFWRLTPVYMAVLMFYQCIYPYMGDGPWWHQQGDQPTQCVDNWWTNLLYINNLVNRDQMCMAHTWYLANDMQFYILSPIILIPLYYSKYLGFAVTSLFLVATMVTGGVLTSMNNLRVGIIYMTEGTEGPDGYMDYYFTPYCRMGPYLVGLVAGYFLYKQSCKELDKRVVVFGWLVATVSALAVLYGPYESANGTPMTVGVAALYNAVHKPIWGACVCWVVIACATDNAGFVNTLLSWGGFVPLSRLTYCAYLIHPFIISLYYNVNRQAYYLQDIILIYTYLGLLVASYGVSFMASLVFEAPMMGIEKALLKRGKRNKD